MWLSESRALQRASIVYRTTNEMPVGSKQDTNSRKRQRELGGEASEVARCEAEKKARREVEKKILFHVDANQ